MGGETPPPYPFFPHFRVFFSNLKTVGETYLARKKKKKKQKISLRFNSTSFVITTPGFLNGRLLWVSQKSSVPMTYIKPLFTLLSKKIKIKKNTWAAEKKNPHRNQHLSLLVMYIPLRLCHSHQQLLILNRDPARQYLHRVLEIRM